METDSISFPNLGITFSHVPQYLKIGSFQIAWYGIVLAAAMVCGIYFAMWLARRTGQSEDIYFNFAVLAVILSVLGARIYYVVFSWDYYRIHPAEIFNLRGGGLAIYGGVVTGVVSAVVYCRMKKLDIRVFLDTAMPALTLGQVIGRWGNFFNREAFGEYTNALTAMRLPLAAVSSDDVTGLMRENIVRVKELECIQAHPTFLYESLWNLVLLLFMLFVILRWKNRPSGFVFLMYLSGYGLGRFWIESLRTDRLLIAGSGIAVSQLLSAVLFAAGAACMIRMFIKSHKGS